MNNDGQVATTQELSLITNRGEKFLTQAVTQLPSKSCCRKGTSTDLILSMSKENLGFKNNLHKGKVAMARSGITKQGKTCMSKLTSAANLNTKFF